MFGLGSLTGIMGAVKGLVGAFKLDPEARKEFEVTDASAATAARLGD